MTADGLKLQGYAITAKIIRYIPDKQGKYNKDRFESREIVLGDETIFSVEDKQYFVDFCYLGGKYSFLNIFDIELKKPRDAYTAKNIERSIQKLKRRYPERLQK